MLLGMSQAVALILHRGSCIICCILNFKQTFIFQIVVYDLEACCITLWLEAELYYFTPEMYVVCTFEHIKMLSV